MKWLSPKLQLKKNLSSPHALRKSIKKRGLDSTLHLEEDDGSSSCGLSQSCNPECPPISLQPSKAKYEIAVLACGEFWVPQRRFSKLDGVKRVVAGYTGGARRSSHVSFQDTKDHTMALFIEYNPSKISYMQLLDFWHENDYPWEEADTVTTQSAIYPTSIEQEQQAKEYVSKLHYEAQYRKAYADAKAQAYVTVDYVSKFYQAEQYQQNYISKQIVAAKEQFLLWANDEAATSLYTILE